MGLGIAAREAAWKVYPNGRANRESGGEHLGATNLVFLDGHVAAVANDTDRGLLRTRAAIGDGADPASVENGGSGT